MYKLCQDKGGVHARKLCRFGMLEGLKGIDLYSGQMCYYNKY